MAVALKGLSDNARKTSISELNGRLADSVALALAVKQAHWNVKGRNFIAIHELFDAVHTNLRDQIDIMAEYTSGGDKLHMAYTFDFLGAALLVGTVTTIRADHLSDRVDVPDDRRAGLEVVGPLGGHL